MNNLISLSGNLDAINKINGTNSSIPDNFDWQLYTSIIKNHSLFNVSLAYNHYIQIGQYNTNIYKLYWRTLYKIPHNFNEESYKRYLEEKHKITLTFKNNEELYKFYAFTGHKFYPLNDSYSRTHFNIPDDFDSDIYVKIYKNARKENINMIYNFYNTNKNEYPLNDKYYRLYYNIPDNFDIKTYNQRYGLNLKSNLEAYKYYDNFGKKFNQLDISYTNIKNIKNNKITNGDNINLNINELNFQTIDDTKNQSVSDSNNFMNDLMNDINTLNTLKPIKQTKSVRIVEPESEHIKGPIKEPQPIKQEPEPIKTKSLSKKELDKILKDYDYIAFKTRYNLFISSEECVSLIQNNSENYTFDESYFRIYYKVPTEYSDKYINNFKQICSTTTFKTNIDFFKLYKNTVNSIKLTANSGNDNNSSYADSLSVKIIEEFIDPNLFIFDDVFKFNYANNKIKLDEIYKIYLNNPQSIMGQKFIDYYTFLNSYSAFIDNDTLKKKFLLLKPFYEEYFSKITNNNITNYTTFFYNTIESNGKNIFMFLNKWEPYYELFAETNYYYGNVSYQFKNTTANAISNIELIFILCDNYTHNYVSLAKTLSTIKHNYKINILTSDKIYASNKCNKFLGILTKTFNINVLCEFDNNDVTFNDLNNLLYQSKFWNKFNSEYLVLLNSLAIITNDKLTEIINNKDSLIGFKCNKSEYLNIPNNNFSVRNKNKLIQLLENIDFNENKDRCSKFINLFKLDKSLENYTLSANYKLINNNFIRIIDNIHSLETTIN